MAIFHRAPHASRQKILNPLCGTEDFVFPRKCIGKTKELHPLLVEAQRRSRYRGPVAPGDGTGVVKIIVGVVKLTTDPPASPERERWRAGNRQHGFLVVEPLIRICAGFIDERSVTGKDWRSGVYRKVL